MGSFNAPCRASGGVWYELMQSEEPLPFHVWYCTYQPPTHATDACQRPQQYGDFTAAAVTGS
jgi:hypothetical protein